MNESRKPLIEETAGSSGTIDVNRIKLLKAKPAASKRPTLGREELADLFDVSVKTIDRMRLRKQNLAPFRVGLRLLRWPCDEISAWVAAGMPDQDTWEQMRSASGDKQAPADERRPRRTK